VGRCARGHRVGGDREGHHADRGAQKLRDHRGSGRAAGMKSAALRGWLRLRKLTRRGEARS
jgi:hypothetical protein